MNLDTVIQIISCALTTVCGIGAIGVAVWTVWESQRPQPVVFLEHDRDKACILIVVQNFGSGIARNLELVGFDYGEMVSERYRETVRVGFVGRGVPLLVPGARRDAIILAGPEDTHGRECACCAVTLRYKEKGILGRSKKVEEEFVLDVGSFAGSPYSVSDVHEIAKATKKASSSLIKIADRLTRNNSNECT